MYSARRKFIEYVIKDTLKIAFSWEHKKIKMDYEKARIDDWKKNGALVEGCGMHFI